VRELGLFAGAGGGLLASRLLGWRTVCAVEIDAHCQRVLAQRQLDGCFEPFPIWDDIRTFDGRPWRGLVDVVSGGFPCQDISSAGRGAGLDGARSGLWLEMLRVIGEVRPAYVFAENSPMLRTRGLDLVLQGLADLGYDAAWGVLGAWHVGAPHRRNRMWIVAANADLRREREQPEHAEVASASTAGERDLATDAAGKRPEGPKERAESEEWRRTETHGGTSADAGGSGSPPRRPGERAQSPGLVAAERGGASAGGDWWSVHRFAGVDDGVASRVERVRATGNGQVPAVAALAWRALSAALVEM
jgi:DNA (cytosine-5)-methyltransferase 1